MSDTPSPANFPVTVFADFVCPFSYVTEAALRGLGDEGVQRVYRAYELYPEGGGSVERVSEEDWSTLERLAEFQGIPLTRPEQVPATRKAHELSRFAREGGREEEVRAAIYRAYWEDGADIGRVDVLRAIAAGAGFDPEDAKIALDIDRFTDEVVADEELARRLRVPGTPTLFLGTGPRAGVLAGAHGPGVLRTMIEDAQRRMEMTDEDV